MKRLLLDCSCGARKDSLVSALLVHLDHAQREAFAEGFNRIGLEDVAATLDDASRNGTAASVPRLCITSHGKTERHAHPHAGDVSSGQSHHSYRSYVEVVAIIDSLNISDAAKSDAIGIYGILAEAEAKAHGVPVEQTHFHEVGNDFAIAYIVAFTMLMDQLAPSQIEATSITTGFGFVDCAHGRLPVPAPATANVLEGMDVRRGDIEGELTTPTGAAMVRWFLRPQ